MMVIAQPLRKPLDEHRTWLFEQADAVWKQPELGFREVKTSERTASGLMQLGIEVERDIALTGLKGELAFGDHPERGPTVAVLAELDAVPCPDHPWSDPLTGAAHACGHHAQIAALLGVALALTQAPSDRLKQMEGRVLFMAVPAEEYVDLQYRERLRRRGEIRFFGGKQEFIHKGHFNGVDAAVMVHMDRTFDTGLAALVPETEGFVYHPSSTGQPGYQRAERLEAMRAAAGDGSWPGYLPGRRAPVLEQAFRDIVENVTALGRVVEAPFSEGTTDFGDVSQVCAALQPMIGAAAGELHRASFRVQDRELAYVDTPWILALLVARLLIKQRWLEQVDPPALSSDDYATFWNQVMDVR